MKAGTPVTLRIVVLAPPPGVPWAIQLGRDALLPPVEQTRDRVVFDVPLTLGENARGTLQLRGPAVQGPAAGRFVYVNSGKRAGDSGSGWDRRAKVPLRGLDVSALRRRTKPLILEGTIAGTSRDGGPACASVPLLGAGWTVREHTG